MMPGTARRAAVLLVTMASLACGRGPRPLVAGADACDVCRMVIADLRFGAEVQMRTGKIHTFDSIECLASFYLAAADRGAIRAVWVVDFPTSRLVPADSALFVRHGSIRSPMGRAYASFAPSASPGELQQRFGGDVLRWGEVLATAADTGATRRVSVSESGPGAGAHLAAGVDR
jgi:copper chaperone NosL